MLGSRPIRYPIYTYIFSGFMAWITSEAKILCFVYNNLLLVFFHWCPLVDLMFYLQYFIFCLFFVYYFIDP